MKTRIDSIRRILNKVKSTPLHPQWFAFSHVDKDLEDMCGSLSGIVADIGCAGMKPRQYLPTHSRYLGIDYYLTATQWYKTRPDIYADAQALPLYKESVDHALLLDVIEHLPLPDKCLEEIFRVLKPGGTLTIQVPFLYPIHDAPLDFHRWTRFGLAKAAERHGFQIKQETTFGHPLESAALNTNIALSKTVLNWIAQKNILSITALVLPVAILAINSLAWVFAGLSRPDPMMPIGYRMVWEKPNETYCAGDDVLPRYGSRR